MSATAAAAARRCAVPLLAALLLLVLLVQPQLASAQTFSYFHFHFLTGPDAVLGNYKYTVVLDADLTATETAPGSGKYRVVSVSGNRTISFAGSPPGELVSLSHTVNFDVYEGFAADNLLTYPATEYGFVDNNGIGFTLEQAQVIVPGWPASNRLSVFNAGFFSYYESTTDWNGVVSSLTVEQYTPPPAEPPADDPPVVDDPSPPTSPGGANGDPVFVGFRGQRFTVDGQPQRVYNVLSLPSLQLNTRFIPLAAGQAMNVTEQRAVYRRQSKLLSVLKRAGQSGSASNPLPATTTWSHAGLYMGETGVQVAGHRLHVVPGAYVSGFDSVQLDGVEVAVSVSQQAVLLADGSSIHRLSPSVVEVRTADVSFSLVNSDHFLNIHSAALTLATADCEHVDGLLGQTAHVDFAVERTAEFKQHVENDFVLPQGEDELWSSEFEHNLYEQ